MEIPRLQWSEAVVEDATLTVPVVGERPKGWRDSFDHTVALLGGGRWGEVRCKSGTVRIEDVPPGEEESVHHFLESVMQQANAKLVAEQEDEAVRPADSGEAEAPEDDDEGADARMTEAFRGFADRDRD